MTAAKRDYTFRSLNFPCEEIWLYLLFLHFRTCDPNWYKIENSNNETRCHAGGSNCNFIFCFSQLSYLHTYLLLQFLSTQKSRDYISKSTKLNICRFMTWHMIRRKFCFRKIIWCWRKLLRNWLSMKFWLERYVFNFQGEGHILQAAFVKTTWWL